MRKRVRAGRDSAAPWLEVRPPWAWSPLAKKTIIVVALAGLATRPGPPPAPLRT